MSKVGTHPGWNALPKSIWLRTQGIPRFERGSVCDMKVRNVSRVGSHSKSRLFNTPLENTPVPARCATSCLKSEIPKAYPNFLFHGMRGTPSFPPVGSANV